MTSFVLLTLHDPEKLNELLAAWEEAGVTGATVMFNTGLGRLRSDEGLRDDIPLIPSLSDFFDHPELHGRTIFTVVDDDSLVDRLLVVTQQIIGDLSQPNTGLLVVLPITRVYGLEKINRRSA
jgi:nitrogen regulatory protein P-II 1